MINREALREALSAEHPRDRLIDDPDVLAGLSHDEAEWAPVGRPAVGITARSELEVQAVVRTCVDLCGHARAGRDPRRRHRPVRPRHAVDGCVLLGLSRTNAVVDIDAANMTCTVQPGLVNNDLKARVAERGQRYTADGDRRVSDLVADGRAVVLVTSSGLIPAALELLDRQCLVAVEEWRHLGIEAEAAALLLARVDVAGEADDLESERVQPGKVL